MRAISEVHVISQMIIALAVPDDPSQHLVEQEPPRLPIWGEVGAER